MDAIYTPDSLDRRPEGCGVVASADGMSHPARMRALLDAHAAAEASRARTRARWTRIRASWEAMWTWEPVSWPR